MNDVAKRDERPPIVVLRDRLEQRKGELAAALPSDIKPDQFIRALITAATIDPNLQACSWNSLWIACMRACRDGLLPDGRQGAIVPFGSNAQWIPMYQGMILRFQKSGIFKWIDADVVRHGELFEFWKTQSGVHFRHVPGDSDQATIERAYAVATTKDGGEFVAVLSIGEINKIRNMSRSTRDDAPWKKWPSEMMKKTALRRLCKMLPSTSDIIADEDVPEIEPAPVTPPALSRVQGTVGDRLEQFAEGGRGRPPSGGEGGALASAPIDSSESAARSGDSPEPAAIEPDTDYEDASHAAQHMAGERAAYEAGQIAKSKGIKRAACPGEYREDPALSAAWVAGWQGEPFPMV